MATASGSHAHGARATMDSTIEIHVVRQDLSIEGNRGLAFWVVSDNLRKGAASNAVELAEVLVERGWIRKASERLPVGAGGRTA